MGPHRLGAPSPTVPVLPAPSTELVPAASTAIPVPDRAPVGLPQALAGLAWTHRARLMPFGWMVAADIGAISIHYGSSNGLTSLAWAAGAAAAVTVVAWWRARDARLKKKIKTLKTVRRVQANVKRAVAAGSIWGFTAVLWTPFGPHGYVQIALFGGGIAVAAPHLYRTRSKPEAVETVREIEPPREDYRLTQFRERFCQVGPLQWARLHDLERVPGGFRFHIELSLASSGTFRDVKMLEDQIAKLHDVPPDHISVEPPESRSARRAVVTVLTETKAHEREDTWDGTSTYDPATGAFVLGRLADGSTSHWQLHKPFNGACCGIAVGVRGSGKTATLHVVASESGMAKLCVECGAARSCVTCRLARICGVWLGDPQQQGFAVWKGRADLTAWGPVSCVRMLSWGFAAMRARSASMGEMEWTDHLGRTNHGKGWFDPAPHLPQLSITIDEWPMIARDPVLGPWATYFAERIGDESRKVGVVLNLGSQEGDVDILGSRGLRNALIADNAIGHRSDRLTRQMLELEGNPAELPQGAPGVGYLRGYDRRSGIVHRTKTLREYLRPGETGVDVREIAERIGGDPILFDQAILQALEPLGYTGPGQVLDDNDGWTVDMLESAPAAASEEPADPVGGQPAQQPARVAIPVSPHELSAVWAAIEHGPTEMFDVMERTGFDALRTTRAVDQLIDVGFARQNGDGSYAPASLTP
jgi:hypothetical protein